MSYLAHSENKNRDENNTVGRYIPRISVATGEGNWGQLPQTLPQLGPEIGVNLMGGRLAKYSGIDVRRCVTTYCSLEQQII